MSYMQNLAEDRANSILSKQFNYPEGVMTRKSWLELMFKKGYELKGNSIHNDKESIELNVTERQYFKQLEDFYCANIDKIYLGNCFESFEKKLRSLVIDHELNETTFNVTESELIDMIKREVLQQKLID